MSATPSSRPVLGHAVGVARRRARRSSCGRASSTTLRLVIRVAAASWAPPPVPAADLLVAWVAMVRAQPTSASAVVQPRVGAHSARALRPARRRARRPPPGPPSPAARTTRLPTITPSASSATAPRLLAGRDPEAHRHRDVGGAAHPLDRLRQPRRQLGALARWCRSATPCRRSRARPPRSRPPARASWSAPPAAPAPGPRRRRPPRTSPASSCGRSGTISPAAPAAAARSANASGPGGQDHVHVDHQHDRQLAPASALADAQHAVRGGARRERLGAGGVDHGPVGERVGERDAQLDQVGARRRRPPGRPRREASRSG